MLLDNIHSALQAYPILAPILFVLLQTMMAAFFLPCSPMTLIAGALWGGYGGLVISMLASILASATTFLLARSFLHDRIASFLVRRYPKIADLLGQVARHDWKIIGLTQINPLMPASSLGYLFGLSKVKFSRYVFWSAVFMLPLQLLFVTTGHSVTVLLKSGEHWYLSLSMITLVIFFQIAGKGIYKKVCSLIGVKNGT